MRSLRNGMVISLPLYKHSPTQVTTRQVTRTILSSVGGFSQSARQNIRSLQDLLATIQRFDLDVFDSRALRHEGFVGEGVSYKVTKCIHTGTNKLYAVKTVKLPQKSADSGTFERQVACVLRDIEVMYGLSQRSNILDIYGYGWDIDSGNVIPYLVTEFAAEGTLRNFLKSNALSIHEKLLLCKDVAQGLHFLHVAGIAHGDLKLDNVLVTPYIGTNLSAMEHEFRTTGMEACISDFGHSLHLYDDEGDTGVKQRYGGTLAYNAPEILDKHKHLREDVNFRKCDTWSLGLAIWEILIDGKAYYHNADVEESIMSSQKKTNSLPTPPPSNAPSQASSAALVEELANIAPQLAQMACKDVSVRTLNKLTPREAGRLHVVFRMCLEHEPKRRLADIPLLPFFHGQKTDDASATKPSRIQVGASTSWSFELFRIADTIPDEVKRQIINDCHKIANEHGQSILTARACFQLGFAYAIGFGFPPDMTEALQWFENAGDKGLHLAKLYLPALRNLSMDMSTTHEECLENYLASNRRAFVAKFSSTLLEVDDPGADAPDHDSEQLLEERIKAYLVTRTHVDSHDQHGNTSMSLASKLGTSSITRSLLDKGASSTLPDTEGCAPLHWLFMYPQDDIVEMASELVTERTGFVFTGSEELKEKILVPLAVNHEAPPRTAIRLDPQLPLSMYGTPLAFAVSMGCKTSVESLLTLGADPLLGISTSGREIQAGSPLAIAFSLHLAEILQLLLQQVLKRGYREGNLLRLLDGLQQVPPAAHVHRALIHGCHMPSAAEETIYVLLDYYRFSSQYPQKWELLKPAVERMDPLLCSAIMKALEKYRPELDLTHDELDSLMYLVMLGACQSGRTLNVAIEMLEFAIRVGANINFFSRPPRRMDRIPLFLVIDRQDAELLDWMLQNTDVDLSIQDDEGMTALHRLISTRMSSTYEIQKLIDKQPNLPDIESWTGLTPIALLTSDRQVAEFKALLPHVPLRFRHRLLEAAIHADAPKLVDANLQDITRIGAAIHLNRALSLAAEVASGEVAEVLISFGAQANKTSGSGFSTMHKAAIHGNIDVLNLCIQLEHDVNQGSTVGTPLLLAITTMVKDPEKRAGAHACADALLDADASPDCMNKYGCTPLSLILNAPKSAGIRHGRFGLIEKLLRKGADPNVRQQESSAASDASDSPESSTEHPLFDILREPDWELAELLVKNRISLDEASKDGNYLLHFCAHSGNSTDISGLDNSRPARLTALLLERGADPFKKDKEGFTALERSIWNHNAPVTLRIVEHIMASAGITRGNLPTTFQEPSVKKSKRKFRNILRDKTDHKDSSQPKIQSHPQEIPELQEGFGLAVFYKSYMCIAAFIKAEAHGPLSYLTRRVALSFLAYALTYELQFVLRKYMGGVNDDGNFEPPDDYLKAVWDSVREYFPWGHKPELLVSFAAISALKSEEPSNVPHFPRVTKLRCGKYPDLNPELHELDLKIDDDILEDLIPWYHRLQYMNALNRATKALPATHMVMMGYYEAQADHDMKEAIVDEEAEQKRREYIALQSILGPIGPEDEFTYESGF